MTYHGGNGQMPGGYARYAVRQPRPHMHPLRAWGIAALIAGPVLVVLAVIIFLIPFGLFLLGGGGNVEAFDDFARGFSVAAGILAFIGAALVVFGIIGVIAGRRRPPRY